MDAGIFSLFFFSWMYSIVDSLTLNSQQQYESHLKKGCVTHTFSL